MQVVPLMRERLIAIDVEVGNQAEVATQLECLRVEAASTEAAPWVRCVAARAQARARRDPDAAERAAGIAIEAGLVFEAAVSRLLAGEFAKDATTLRVAYETFRDLAAEPWRRRAAAALRELGQSVPRRKADPGVGMSPTERSLAQLVSDGLTNREIGRAMHLSPKTIEVYLSRLFSKTGCSSRVELAVAVRSGTVDVSEPDQ